MASLGACGDDSAPADSGTDSGVDSSTGGDAGEDAGTDAGEDAAMDAAMDAPRDSAPPDPVGEVVFNEIVANHIGMDTAEYIELLGDADTDLSSLSILVLEGDGDSASASPGVIEDVLEVGTTDAEGFWQTGFLPMDTLENGSQTYLLVQGFTGAALMDLDEDDDGTLERTPWALILDELGVNDGGDGDLTYAGTSVLSPNDDGVDITFGGASRFPDGTDTDMPADWLRNDFDGAGIAALDPGTPQDGEALNTPGTPNAEASSPVAVINEFVFNHEGSDDSEFIEVLGNPDTDLSSLTFLVIEGDDLGQGRIEVVAPLDSTDADGYWSTTSDNFIENGTSTAMLVLGFTGVRGVDVDTDDDGTPDDPPWLAVLDSVSISDGEAGDLTYSSVVLTPDFDGGETTVGGASRIPNGTDTDATGDWVRNEFTSPGEASAAASGEAVNTPGAENMVAP